METEVMPTISLLIPAFDATCALWATHEANPCAHDVGPGDPLSIANNLQATIGALMACIPAATSEEALTKLRVADRLEIALDEVEVAGRLRASAGADLTRLAA